VKPRIFRALLWLRWRETVHALHGRRGGDAMERVSSVLGAIAPWLLVLLVLPAAVACAVGGVAAGWFAAAEGSRRVALTVVRFVLFLVTLFAFLGPLLATMGGTPANPARLLLLPIPRVKLYVGDIVSRLADPFFVIFVPGVLCFPLGLLAAGATLAALVGLVAGLWFVALALVGQALVAFAVGLLLRDRRRGEVLTLAVVLFVSTLGIVGSIVGDRLDGQGHERRVHIRISGEGKDGTPPSFLAFSPSELHVRSVTAALEARPAGAARDLGLGLLLLVGLDALAQRAHRRLLEQPAGGSGRRRQATAVVVRAWRLPGMRPAVAALAAAHVRAARRSLPGKVALLFPALFGVLITLAMRAKLERFAGELPFPAPMLLASGILVLCLVMLQQELVNVFAKDGAGLTLQLVQPLADRELVQGKLVGSALTMLAGLAPALLLVAAILRGVPPLYWAALALLAAASVLWTVPIGAILSAALPKKVNLSSFKTAKPHQGATFVAILGAAFLTGLPVGAALLIATFAGPGYALAFAATWIALSAVAGAILAALAARLVARRRENLALVVQGS